jgi:prevent-host-death family protein
MQIMTAKDAKTHFGELMDTMQREPVLITKNNRPVGAFVSLEDLQGTHIAELFAEKEEGHDEWVKAQVMEAMARKDSGQTTSSPMHEVHARVMEKVRARMRSTR